ncbi:hypothetical protein O5O45_12915 [Hahella aquimaris]|uniref:hypothetical protein n=1 Tax=Hahella sp. HNIBRBA332 TaxID=3015983 RepID=UPI00273B7C25|nr:hypothetical protein [Hahella sp. HNIBRBA332]WLQ16818.1 hypothetical protein O5O45_12915 [Hahella sp. HNIBRBA332]
MNTTRIGVIEVGSRSVRYLVIDVPERLQDFILVKNANAEHGVDPRQVEVRDIDKLNAVIERLSTDLLTHSCDMTCVYGTALCRLIEKEFPGRLSEKIHVLSTEEEGKAAWITGFLCQNEESNRQPISVIDLGNGSTEIVRGAWDGSGIVDLKTVSFPVGSSWLVDIYSKNEKKYTKFLQDILSSVAKNLRQKGIEKSNDGVVYVAGGVVTKIAWQMVRENDTDLYRPEAVNGVIVKLDDLTDWFAKTSRDYKLSPLAVQKTIDPRRNTEKEALRTLSGGPYIWGLVTTVHAGETFLTTGYGLRHGIAFLLKNELIPH